MAGCGLVLVPDEEGECLELYAMSEWEKHIADLETDKDVHRDRKAREFFRDYTGKADAFHRSRAREGWKVRPGS